MAKNKEIKVELEYNKENLRKFNIVGNSVFRWAILLLLIMYSLFQIGYLINKTIDITLVILSFFLIAVCYFYDYYLSNITYKRTKLNNNNEDLKLYLKFNDENIISQKINDKNGYTYPYDAVKKIVETKDMLIIILKYRLGFPIMKTSTTSEQIEDIKKQVVAKNNAVKIRRYHPFDTKILLVFLVLNAILLGISLALK